MPVIITPTPWTRQPQWAVETDRAHPSNRQTLILRDLSIAQPSVTRTGTVVRPTPAGVVLGFGTTKGAGATDLVALPSMTFPSAMTLIFTVSRNGAGGGSFGRLFEIAAAAAWSITASSGTLAFSVPWSSSPIWTTTDSMPSTLTTVVLTYDGSSTSNNPRVWWGGVERSFGAASPAPTGSLSSVKGTLYIGNRSDSARAWDGEIGVVGVLGGTLTASEAAYISATTARPWQLFAPITRRIWVPSAGGATTHTSTGALAAQAASIAGTATHKTLHTSTGALSSQAASIAGTATHKTLHTSTGALAAQVAAVAGTAARSTTGATHTSTGALAAQAAAIAGTAIHRILHTSTGALIAQSAAVIAGTAIHYALHTSSGALASQSATIAGSASGPGPDDVSGDTIVALRSISHNTHRRM